MSEFRVWAPHAHSVDLVLHPRPDLRTNDPAAPRSALRPCGRGWWELEVTRVPPGTDYAFSINSGSLAPDPRSPWQPYGVHGPSRTLDHSAFQWTDRRWTAPSP